MPYNSYITSKNLANVATFDIFPTQQLYLRLFSFTETEETEIRFQLVGLETKNFLLNAGTLFVLLFFWLPLVLSYFVYKSFKPHKTLLILLSRWLFVNYLLRMIIESCLDFTIIVLLSFEDVKLRTLGDNLSFYFSLISFSLVILFVFVAFGVVWTFRKAIVRGY